MPKKGVFGAREDGKIEIEVLDQIKQARQEIKRAPILALKKRLKDFKKEPTISRAFGIFFSVIGVRAITDWQAARKNFKPLLKTASNLLLEELRMDPKFKANIQGLVDKGIKWLTFDKHGNLIMTSFNGNIVRKPKMDINDSTMIQKREFRLKTRIDVSELLKQAKVGYTVAQSGKEEMFVINVGSRLMTLVNKNTNQPLRINPGELTGKAIFDVKGNPKVKKLVIDYFDKQKQQQKKLELVIETQKAEQMFNTLLV